MKTKFDRLVEKYSKIITEQSDSDEILKDDAVKKACAELEARGFTYSDVDSDYDHTWEKNCQKISN